MYHLTLRQDLRPDTIVTEWLRVLRSAIVQLPKGRGCFSSVHRALVSSLCALLVTLRRHISQSSGFEEIEDFQAFRLTGLENRPSSNLEAMAYLFELIRASGEGVGRQGPLDVGKLNKPLDLVFVCLFGICKNFMRSVALFQTNPDLSSTYAIRCSLPGDTVVPVSYTHL
ncbi:MAG: hypothetical protein N2654_07725, partial [Deltaproteobacteria bacterium]|nr:hypothetical protein [Deltaproteobacteria bacterium]